MAAFIHVSSELTFILNSTRLLPGSHGSEIWKERFRRVCGFEKQSEGLNQVRSRVFDRQSLTRNIDLRTKGDECVSFSLDDRGQTLPALHSSSLQRSIGYLTLFRKNPIRRADIRRSQN